MKNQETLPIKPLMSPTKAKQFRRASQLAAIQNHEYALQRMKMYNENPNHCRQCTAAILIPPEKMNRTGFQQIRKKKFCNQSCGAKYNMARSPAPRNKPKIKVCSQCGGAYSKYQNKLNRCKPCVQIYLNRLQFKTKAECNIETIRCHARNVLFETRPKVCQVCGYSFHADACHIKPIRTFPSVTLVGEINALSNLAALCKNHHDELDKGALIL
jgi:hypothetical protein